MSNNNPTARKTNIVIQELNDEVLIYDLEEDKAFCLNETSRLVWELCDGNRDVTEIRRRLVQKLNKPVSEELIWLALDQLSKENLLFINEKLPAKFAGLSRREAIRRLGVASMIALPFIASLVAPTAAMAASCRATPVNLANGSSCSRNCQCTSNCCDFDANKCTNRLGNTCKI